MIKKLYIVSGGFDPIHEGHIAMIQDCIERGADGVIILLNSDEWLIRKKGKPFMKFSSRFAVCQSIKNVVLVTPCDDGDGSVCKGLRNIRAITMPEIELVFANGGDRTKYNIPEIDVCKELGIKVEFGVGGQDKMNSSSQILSQWENHIKGEK